MAQMHSFYLVYVKSSKHTHAQMHMHADIGQLFYTDTVVASYSLFFSPESLMVNAKSFSFLKSLAQPIYFAFNTVIQGLMSWQQLFLESYASRLLW